VTVSVVPCPALLAIFCRNTCPHFHFGRIILLGFAAVALCSAGDIYIAQNAAGASSGLNCTDAHSASWFNSSANWGIGASQIGPGVTVHLCGNITAALKFQASGQAGNPIMLLFETGASMTTTVWAGPAITMDNRNNIIVDGGVPCGTSGGACNGIISSTNNYTDGTHGNGSRGINADACNNCEIRNIGIYNIYVHTGTGSEIDQSTVRCISYYGNNFLIHDSTMHDAGWCLVQDTGNPNPTTTRIYNNDIYNVDHGWALTLFGSSTATGLPAGPYYFYNNHVHDYANWDTSENSYHHDGIHCYSTGGGRQQVAGAHITDLWIYNNLFDGDPGVNLTGHIFLEAGIQSSGATPCMDATSKVHMFGNIFTIPSGRADWNGVVDLGVHSNSDPLQSFDFYNNTVSGMDTAASDGSRALVIENGASSAANLKNNIFGGANYLITLNPGSATDYNGYVRCPSLNCWSGVPTFKVWRSDCACDLHSINSIGNSGGVIPATGALQAGSPMIGAGANLTTAVLAWPIEQQNALAIDRNGQARGGGHWDIGALSSGSVGARPSPPTGLIAIPH
jgi:hypothetical protein